jgi:ribose transport system substrate-binding protein
MKRYVAVFVVLAVLLTGFLAGCGSTPTQSTDNSTAAAVTQAVSAASTAASTTGDQTEKVIGLCFPSADHGWVAAVIYNAEQQAKALGVKYILTTGANANEQSGKIDELIAQKVSAIVMLPTDTDPMTPAAQRVLDAKIPLIIFDRKVNVTPTYYIAGDNAGMGINAAKFIGDKLGGKGNVVIVGVPAYGSVSTERVNGFKDTLTKNYPDMKIVKEVGAENSSKEAGLKIMGDLLAGEKQIDAVYSIDDELSIGLLQAIKENERKDVKIVTGGGGAKIFFDAIKSEADVTLASFLYSPTMVKEAVKAGVDIMNGTMPSEASKIIPSDGVTKENVDQYYDANSPY